MTDFFSVLPHFNAFLNFSSFVLLTSGYLFIRRRNVIAHRNCQIAALCVSVLFLVSYLTYHAQHGATKFTGQGIVRPIYFVILTTHTILAVVILPLAILSVMNGLRMRVPQHRRVARWTFPLWMYVSVTGVLVYFFLYHWFPSA